MAGAGRTPPVDRELQALRQHAVYDLRVDQVRPKLPETIVARRAPRDIRAQRDRRLRRAVAYDCARVKEVMAAANGLINVRCDLIVFRMYRGAAGAASAEDDSIRRCEQMREV